MSDLPDAVVEAAAREQEKHVGLISTQSMQTDGDDGGLKCSCEQWSAGPDENGYRPWKAWHEHVARAALAAASGPWAEHLDAARAAIGVAHDDGHSRWRQMKAERDAALARNAGLERTVSIIEGAQAKSEDRAEALRAELDNLRGKCICNTGPGTDGPDETCPVHGRPYAEWVERGDQKQAELDNLRESLDAVKDVLDEYCTAGCCQHAESNEKRLHDLLRAAIVRGSDDE